ncbi:PilZ domain-containing protein [SAR92 clade bacterium H921]|nr:PilZ domain-containing protein [SAR92 clade bacterium H921]
MILNNYGLWGAGGIKVMGDGFSGNQGGVLTLDIHNESELHEHYMSFVQGGAIFVPTKRTHVLEEDVNLLLHIYLRNDPITIAGKVVWITHKGAGTTKTEGVGIQFTDEQAELKLHIEQALTGDAFLDLSTQTI